MGVITRSATRSPIPLLHVHVESMSCAIPIWPPKVVFTVYLERFAFAIVCERNCSKAIKYFFM